MKINVTFLLFLLLFLACGPDPSDEEPPFVCEGELPCLETDNSAYAAAYINGEVWESGTQGFGVHEDNSVYLQDENILGIILKKFQSSSSGGEDISQSISFAVVPLQGMAYTSFERELIFFDRYSVCFNGESESREYLIDSSYVNRLELIGFDLAAQTASGYFDMRVINPYCNDTLLITDGRFNCFFTIQ